MIVVHFKFDDALNKHDNLGLHFTWILLFFLQRYVTLNPNSFLQNTQNMRFFWEQMKQI